MGYTHYWKGQICGWEKCSRDIVRLLESSPVPLSNGLGDKGTSPEIAPNTIWFNGEAEDAHETFSLSNIFINFGFCKTAQKPYDAIVTAALCIAAHYGLTVSSDGDRDDWQEGLALARKIIPDVGIPI